MISDVCFYHKGLELKPLKRPERSDVLFKNKKLVLKMASRTKASVANV